MRTYNELSLEERMAMQQRLASGDSLRAVGRSLGRSPSTISPECRRVAAERSDYKAQAAQRHSQVCRKKPRVTRKLDDAALWETMQALLRARGADRRGQIPDRQSIHVRPPEIEQRLIPGHWEGDLIKARATAPRWARWSSAPADLSCWPR